MEQLADYDKSHNIEVLGGRSGTPYDAFTLATNAKKNTVCVPLLSEKNYIQLETNTLLFDFFEPLPTISYCRKRPFVVTTQNLRESPIF